MRKLSPALVVLLSQLISAGVSGDPLNPAPSNPFDRFDELHTGDAAFQCSFATARSVTSDGKLGEGGAGAQWFKEHYNNFVFDAGNGSFRVRGQTTHWNVLRHGGSQNDLIAHLPGNNPMHNIIRIRTWSKPISFWMTDGTDTFSGLCDRVR